MPLCKIENREYKLEAILKIGCKFKFRVDTKQTSGIFREKDPVGFSTRRVSVAWPSIVCVQDKYKEYKFHEPKYPESHCLRQ